MAIKNIEYIQWKYSRRNPAVREQPYKNWKLIHDHLFLYLKCQWRNCIEFLLPAPTVGGTVMLFTHPLVVVPNLYEFLYSVEHKIRNFNEC